MNDTDPVALGVDLLAHLDRDQLSLKEALDHIETITREPRVQRAILDRAATRGVIARDGSVIRPKGGHDVDVDPVVVTRSGSFNCDRCGANLQTGYFIEFDSGEIGPFGSTCITKVTNRNPGKG